MAYINASQQRLYTAAEVAKALNKTARTVLQWRAKGLPGALIPNRYSAGSYYFERNAVADWLREHKPAYVAKWEAFKG